MLPRAVMSRDSLGAQADGAQVERAMRRLLAQHSERRVDCRLMLSSAFPTLAITGALERVQPDLLSMGTGAHGWLRRALLGSVAREVLAVVRCDVLVVPHRSGSSSVESHLGINDASEERLISRA